MVAIQRFPTQLCEESDRWLFDGCVFGVGVGVAHAVCFHDAFFGGFDGNFAGDQFGEEKVTGGAEVRDCVNTSDQSISTVG